MGDEVQQQRWDFRRRDTYTDSSSDESESGSELAPKKHNLVSSLISLENNDAIGNCRVQLTGTSNPRAEDQVVSPKGKRVRLRSRKGNWTKNDTERDCGKKVGRKKSKASVYNPAALDELQVFMDSLVEELKVARQNLFSRMRKEMRKLVADDDDAAAAARLKRRKGTSSRGKNVRVQHGDNFEKSTQGHKNRKSKEDTVIQHQNNFKETVQVQQHHGNFEGLNFQVNYPNNFESSAKAQENDIGDDNCHLLKPNLQFCSTNKNVLRVQHQMKYTSGRRAQTYTYLESSFTGRNVPQSNHFYPVNRADSVQEVEAGTSSEKERGGRLELTNQVASSMYLTHPSVLTNPCGESHMLGTSSTNYIHTPFDTNKLGVNSGNENPILKMNGNYAQTGSTSVSCFDTQSIPSSSTDTGFQVPLHRGLDIGVSIANPTSFGYLHREEKNIMGLTTDGASKFSSGSYGISEDYLANSFYRPFN